VPIVNALTEKLLLLQKKKEVCYNMGWESEKIIFKSGMERAADGLWTAIKFALEKVRRVCL